MTNGDSQLVWLIRNCANVVIVWVICIHLVEAAQLLFGFSDGDWTYSFRALLWIGGHEHRLTGLIVVSFVLLALISLGYPQLPSLLRFAMCIPQLTLLLIVAGWVIVAAILGVSAQHQPVSTLAILDNQCWRVTVPIIYGVSIFAKLRLED